jgi:uncharacterized protein (DUF2126 family)/transglutaminase-like putative cysteine protease
MSIRVALHHRTAYEYDRPVSFGPHVARLRPAPHCRTPIKSYSFRCEGPDEKFLNWQQDAYGNYQARLVFPKLADKLVFEVDLVAEMTVINPFDFFLDEAAEEFPFSYSPTLLQDLAPYLRVSPLVEGSPFAEYLRGIDKRRRRTNDFLVDVNQQLQRDIKYLVRLEPGVQSPDETLALGSGSCRDSGWLLVNLLRHMGLAARFVSGYLIQLTADQKSLDGPSGPEADFTDLHAWTEVFLPGAGWVGVDPTSGLMAGEGHIPLACTPEPISAAPITGTATKANCEFSFDMTVTRVFETPRVTKPYTRDQWNAIEALGHEIDAHLAKGDVRLTMGGEPTFVSIDDMEGAEWKTEAVGPHKRRLAGDLLGRLKQRFAPGGLLHIGQGKWYPGEPLPRWALACYWRRDGEPIWNDESLFADPTQRGDRTPEHAREFAAQLAERLGVKPEHAIFGYEDSLYYTWRERRLPANVDLRDSKLENKEERERLARLIERGLTTPTGCVLPLRRVWWTNQPYWESGEWVVRSDEMFLIPGDSAMGFRLPLQSLIYSAEAERQMQSYAADPIGLSQAGPLPAHQVFRDSVTALRQPTERHAMRHIQPAPLGPGEWQSGGSHLATNLAMHQPRPLAPAHGPSNDPSWVVRTALCVEPRDGVLHIFMPPLDRAEDYLELVAAIEQTAAALQTPVVIEGYLPPHDPRLQHIKVTPDPGVIEVNVHPAASWDECVDITQGVYHDARQSRLGTEKFDLDGTHTGTGGGNHVVLGGPTPADSPFLRRPDLLRSLTAYWHNHPSLSYLLSGQFIGPTSQAPRVDEGRRDAAYELQIAYEQIPDSAECPPWLVDRLFRNLLIDGTGNTHRAEFCIDKLYAPETATGRLGLVEFRAFEMPPHAEMSLAQQLLLRCLIARFWEQPYKARLVDWDTTLHDRFMLPEFVRRDFYDVVTETRACGYKIEADWFAPHFEFRFPLLGEFSQANVHVEIRKAIEPWYVLGEEPAGGATARYVDSSVERCQVLVQGMTDTRHLVACNGRRVPLHPTGTEGEFVAGVRYRAWQPPSCLHPTIGIDTPLVFDLLDTWMGRSIGGGTYHVSHPGGNNPATFPVNAAEAESRRGARFFASGHTPGPMKIPVAETNPAFPLTLDLRRRGS